MNTGQRFGIDVILMTYFDRPLADWNEYRAFLDFMCGEHVELWNIAHARREVRAVLHRQLGELRHLEAPGEKMDTVTRALKGYTKILGYTDVELTPMRKGHYFPVGLADAYR